jgi:hypothetical protein
LLMAELLVSRDQQVERFFRNGEQRAIPDV